MEWSGLGGALLEKRLRCIRGRTREEQTDESANVVARNVGDHRVDHQIANNISEFRRRKGFLLLFLAIYVDNNKNFSQNI